MSNTTIKMINAKHYKLGIKDIHYKDSVDHCPYCKHSMSQAPESARFSLPYNSKEHRNDSLFLFYQCMRDECQKAFIAVFQYRYDGNRSPFHVHYLQQILPSLVDEKYWPEEVNSISKQFSEIYNQAVACESHGYNHAAGPTYRKSLEFLIKDYLINCNPNHKDEIKSKFLGNCINDYITDQSIKECAKRAAWLGNDETHYVKKWESKDIGDLKVLIKLTVNHIQTTLLTKKYLEEME